MLIDFRLRAAAVAAVEDIQECVQLTVGLAMLQLHRFLCRRLFHWTLPMSPGKACLHQTKHTARP